MEDSSKKSFMIGVIVVCLAVAGIVTFTRRSSSTGGGSVSRSGRKVLVKCSNPDCGADYEMDEKEYHEEISERIDRTKFGIQPLVCKKCEKESIYKALKCPKCEAVFFYASSDDYVDRIDPEFSSSLAQWRIRVKTGHSRDNNHHGKLRGT